jgi:hypothetical protein
MTSLSSRTCITIIQFKKDDEYEEKGDDNGIQIETQFIPIKGSVLNNIFQEGVSIISGTNLIRCTAVTVSRYNGR